MNNVYLDALSFLFFIIVFVHFVLNWIHNIYSFTSAQQLPMEMR